VLILCSNGLSSEKLLHETMRVANGCKSAALVVTADNEYKQNNYHVKRCISELNSLGLTVDIFDIDIQNPELLLNYDVIEFIGGNPYYLLNSIRKSNALPILKTIAENKILIGWSAAAFVFGPTLKLSDLYSADMNFLGLTDLSGIALTDIQVLPHYSKFCARITNFEEICNQYEIDNKVKVIRLNDGDGLFIRNNIFTRI